MNFDDYEQLPTPSMATNMIAGGLAGILEHCVMFPVDSLKTRMQSLLSTASNKTLVSTYKNMVESEGKRRLFRGVGAVVVGAGPAHALYFSTYEHTKSVMSNIWPQYDHINYVVAGITATLIHDAISNPTEVIKQRLQMYNSPYRTVLNCLVGVYRSEGFKAFYRSYLTQLCMNLPHQIIQFSTYELIQNKWNKERKYDPFLHVVGGGIAGALASACTTPLDVVKTLLNTQETGVGVTRGMREAISQIYRVAGPFGFFKGLSARVIYSTPATAICWSTYEFFKFFLSCDTNGKYQSSVLASNSNEKNKTFDKIRIPDEQISKSLNARYVIPKSTVTEIITDSSSLHHSSSTKLNLKGSQYVPAKSCELPSISGVGYTAINMNSMHTDREYDSNVWRSNR